MQIDKDIPMPPPRGRHTKYPFRDMEVGDSIAVAAEERDRIVSAASYFGKRNAAFRFTVRRHNGAYRLWRIEAKR